MNSILFLCSGFVALYYGADWFVKGSSKLALRYGISSLVIGLTIVSFGTSAPELFVSLQASYNNLGSIAIGNVVGSNIFNIGVILGLSALIHPLKVNLKLIKIDAPIMVGFSFLLWFLLRDQTLARVEGAILCILFLGYAAFTVFMGKEEALKPSILENPDAPLRKPVYFDILLIVFGLAILVVGSKLFVRGATEIAILFNLSEAIIGLTIVAMGTSLPELATSIIAALKGEEDIAIGNIIGSNIFNIVGILGVSGLLLPLKSEGIGSVDFLVMTLFACILLPLMKTGFKVSRLEGTALGLLYVGYVMYLLK